MKKLRILPAALAAAILLSVRVDLSVVYGKIGPCAVDRGIIPPFDHFSGFLQLIQPFPADKMIFRAVLFAFPRRTGRVRDHGF